MHERRNHIDAPASIPVPVPGRAGPLDDRVRTGPDAVRDLLGALHATLRAVSEGSARRNHEQCPRTLSDADVVHRVYDAGIVRVPDGEQRVVGRGELDGAGGGDVVDRDGVDVREAVLLLRHADPRAQVAGPPAADADHHPGRRGRDPRSRGRRRHHVRLQPLRQPRRPHHPDLLLRRGRRPHPRPDPVHVPIPPTARARLARRGIDADHLHPGWADGADRGGAATARGGRQHAGPLCSVQPRHVPDGGGGGPAGDRMPAAGAADDGAGGGVFCAVAVRAGRPRLAPRAGVVARLERHHLPDRHPRHLDPAVRPGHGLALLPRRHRHPDALPRPRLLPQRRFHPLEDLLPRAAACPGRSARQGPHG